MKLFLTSAGLKNETVKNEFVKILNKTFEEIRIIMFSMIGTQEEQGYIDESIQELLDLGVKKDNLHLFNLAKETDCPDLSGFDMVYICGGNTFYYLDRIRKLNCFDKINNFVKAGGLYFGVSAGSILAGPDIMIAEPWDENDINLQNLSGFNFIDFTISPHFQNKEKEIIKKVQKENNLNVRLLTDDQAFFVDDDEVKLVGDGPEVTI